MSRQDKIMEKAATTERTSTDGTQTSQMDDLSFLWNTPLDPISQETLDVFGKVSMGLWTSFSCVGVFTNIINMHTFIRMTLDDSVTISFFALAISDFFNCCLSFAKTVAIAVEIMEVDWQLWFRIRPLVATGFLELSRKAFTSTTVLITTYLAIQRCLCVYIPFHVKGMFTKFNTYCYLAGSFLLGALLFGLYISRHVVVEHHSPIFNSSQIVLYVLPDSEPYFFLVDIVLGVIITIGSQIIVVVCLVLMVVTLNKSLRFRHSAKASRSVNAGESDGSGGKSSTSENAKEMQALKQVALISLIFVCCNSTYVGISLTRLFIPQFALYLAYHNMLLFMFNVMIVTENVNSAVNFFIYYKFNTKFKKLCVVRV